MDLPTYSSIWKTRRIIHKVEDVRLPMPVPADVLLPAAICYAAWDGFWWAVMGNGPFSALAGHRAGVAFGLTALFYALPPFFAARVLTHPNREGKNAVQAVRSVIRFYARPRVLDGFVSRRHIKVWLRTSPAPADPADKCQFDINRLLEKNLRMWEAVLKAIKRRKGKHEDAAA